MQVDVVKTGMLPSIGVFKVLCRILKEYKILALVVDPVMASTSGDVLANSSILAGLWEELLLMADIVTPNLKEASALLGGGDLPASLDAVDVLFDGINFHEFRASRIQTRNTHGTGCSLASCIAAELAKGSPMVYAVQTREEDEEIGADGANYQLEMMRCLREVNVDNTTVGWYQSTLLGSFQTVELIETFMNYQENIKRCVCIIYDPSKSNQGVLALKAMKLSDSFMELYRNNNFTGEKLREKNLSWVDIFEEIPIKVSNSALISAFMTELEADTPVTQCDYDRLQLSTKPFMERNVEFLIECMDELSMEQQKLQFYYRNLSRQQAQQQAWLQKRRAENNARKAAGDEPLPEEDPSNPIFKPVPEPSRLESFLITNQISNYCNQINGVAGQSFSRLYLMKALQEN